MLTEKELKKKIGDIIALSDEISKLKKRKEMVSIEVITDIDEKMLTDLDGVKLVIESLRETATKEGREELKRTHTSDIDKYITVSLSRYVNTRGLKKVIS